MKKTSAFTLIEMLIVIVIIGILAAALVPRLQSVQGRARDTDRKVDLKAINTANEIYLLDNGQYVKPGFGSYNANNYTYSTGSYPITGNTRIPLLTGIITSVPTDPINNTYQAWSNGAYSYYYGNVYTTPINTYDLGTKLENNRDPERNAVKNYLYTTTTGLHAPWSPFNADGQLYEYSPNSNSY